MGLCGRRLDVRITGTGGDLIGASNVTAALLAFTAGLISFFSPCVLPLVPAYIGYLSGAAVGVRPQKSGDAA